LAFGFGIGSLVDALDDALSDALNARAPRL